MEHSRGCRCRFGVSLLLLAFLSFPNKGLALINLRDKYVSQSSNYTDGYPTKAVDDDIYSISHTQCGGNQWWRVDLENAYRVERITIVNRHDRHGSRLTGAIVRAGLNLDHSRNQQIGSSVRYDQAYPGGQTIHFVANPSVMARYVSVELSRSCLQLADLRIEEETVVSTGELVDFTCFNDNPILSLTAERTFISGYKGNSTLLNDVVSFGRTVVTATGDGLPTSCSCIPSPSSGQGSLIVQQFMNCPSGFCFCTGTGFSDCLYRIGAFYCQIRTGTTGERITTITLNSDAVIIPERQTITVSTGESLTLSVTTTLSTPPNYKWRRTSATPYFSGWLDNWDGAHSPTVNSVTTADGGVYECHVPRQRAEGRHAIIRVIVRECPSNMWGPSDGCQNPCPVCYNGGMCHDVIGECICAPGFSGSHCQIANGRNAFGLNGTVACATAEDRHSTACQGKLFCLQDPFGCICAAGYKGIGCNQECDESNTFGPYCSQTCHCADGITCLKDTGECNDPSCTDEYCPQLCAPGWKGKNCQVQTPCALGYYGELCLDRCNCRDNEACDEETGVCSNGCADGYRGAACDQDGSRAIAYFGQIGKPNAGQPVTVRCEAIGNPLPRTSDVILQDRINQRIGPDRSWESSELNDYKRINEYILTAEGSVSGRELTCYIHVSGSNYLTESLTLDLYEPPYLESAPRAGDRDASSITVNWDLWSPSQGRGGGDGPVLRYEVHYRRWSDAADNMVYDYALRASNASTSLVVSGLEVDTQYDFVIIVVREGEGGAGPPSRKATISTTCAAPTAPPAAQLGVVSGTELHLSWQLPDESTRQCDSLENIQVYVKQRSDSEFPAFPSQLDPSGTDTRLGSLVPCTQYDVYITFSNRGGLTSPRSNTVSATTATTAPGPVNSLQVFQPDGISHNQLGVTWSAWADTNCPVDAYIISYTLTRIFACSSSIADPVTVTQTVSSSVTTVSLNNLKPYSRYSVAVMAMNSAGNSTQSTSTQSTTSTVSSFIPTVNLQESDVTSDSIRFTWDEVPCEELNSPLSYYNYKTELRNQATGELFSSNLRYQVKRATQLTPCTSYSFEVAVRNTIGIGSYSNATEVTTSTVAPSQVQALSVDSVEDQPTALRVRWNQPSGNCPIDNYTIHYDLVWLSQCEIPESNRTLVGTTEGTEYSITGLFPHSRYKVDVTAKTSAGEGDGSYVYAYTADAAPSEPPRGITNTATLERGLRFEWQPPSCQGRRGIITGYGYRLLDQEERGVNITENTPSNETQADFSGLVPYTLYSFQVLARTSAGDGPYSEAIRLRTAQAKPPQVPMVTTPGANATSITVRWRRPDPPHGIIIAYYIRYGIVPQGNEEVKVTEGLNDTVLEFVLTGLVADSNYSMQVQAETIVSRGSWSEPSFCTTLETVPSAPVGVHLDNKGDNCLVTWNPPEQGNVISYKIFRNAYLIPRDGSDDLDPIRDLNASDFVVTDDTTPRTYSVKKSDLATYTRYRFQISASTQAGEGSVSKETNSICDSPRAAPVELQQPMISDTPGNPVFDRTFKVTIGSISQRNGPVSCVEITIIWLKTDENVEGTDPDILYHPDLYRSYEDAKVTQGLPYVAVVLEGNDLIESKEVTIGSGGKSECQSTGSRRKRRQAPMIHEGENGALTPDSKYTAFIRAYVVLDNGMEDYVTSPLLQPVWTAQATDFTAIIAGMCVLSVVLLVVLIAFGVILRRRRAKSFQPSPTVVTTNVEMDEIDYERPIKPDDRQSTVYEDVGLPTWALRWEILWKNLVVDDKVLGQGNFGEVRLGTVNVSGKKTETAIKVLKGRASETDREDFMEEFRTMTNIGYHPNVVSLLGACQHKDVLYVALEYLPKGDLRSYLRTGRLQSESDEGALSPDQLIKFALDVAKGMEHLAMSGVIHRDLAARNILLGETLVAKVSDFGLSRGEDIYVQMSKRRVPTRWLAIESLSSRTYTTQSDVWSFGILLWEIASIGGTPYATIATKSLLARLMQGYRMPKPINCDKEIFSLMLRCWEEDPSNRPSFSDLVRIFSDLSDKKVQHTYMAVDRAHYANFSVIRPERDDN